MQEEGRSKRDWQDGHNKNDYICYVRIVARSKFMQVNDLKYNLLDKLISVRDLDTLKKINDLIGDIDINKSIFKITDAQKQMLTKSEEDIRNGKVISDDELNAEEDQWLNG
ncbi:MAG TPA: hypothetical protein VG847_12225 [Chitinophagaceae bacterium]|nr:hypothetical protein [Chitinophagaceae bacterium]